MAINISDYLKRASGSADNDTDKNAQATQNARRYIYDNSSEGQNASINPTNPFLNRDGSLRIPALDYDRLLASSKVPSATKKLISEATGKSYNNETESTTPTLYSDGKRFQFGSGDSGSIVDNATKYLGTPYVWGGESAEEGGMDCSGFVYNALRDSGYDVGRTTAQGYRNYGTSIPKSEMQPGDLVFFGSNNNDASHIGIYIGNGQMIHSSGGSKNTKSNPGKGVSITSVDYRSDFLEARRY